MHKDCLPEITAYQDPAFFLNIINDRKGYEALLYNSYIDFVWNPNEKYKLMVDIDYGEQNNFYDVETIRLTKGWEFISSKDPYEFFVKLIVKKLKEGYYITGMFDEYYIPFKKRYKTEHYRGQFYLIGCDNEKELFYSVGTDVDKPYGQYELTFEDLRKSIEDKPENAFSDIEYTNMFSFIKCKDNDCVFSIEKIYNSIGTLLNIDLKKNELHGFSAVDYFLEHLHEEYKKEYIILICDHAKLMYQRINYMSSNILLPDLFEYVAQYKQILIEINNLYDLINGNKKINTGTLKNMVRAIIEKERTVLSKLYYKFKEVNYDN